MDHFIGRETLKRGLSKYVAKYSYKNADLEEFVACLNEAQNEISSDSTLDLQKWTDSWLKTKGPSQISVEFLVGKLNIKQNFPKYADHTYRSQKIDLKLVFKKENGDYKSVTLPLVTVAAEWLTVDVI